MTDADRLARERNKVTLQIREMRGVIEQLCHEVERMKGLFDDSDGNIQAALDAAEKYR